MFYAESSFSRIKETKNRIVQEKQEMFRDVAKTKKLFNQMKAAVEGLVSRRSDIEVAVEAIAHLQAYKP